MIKNYEFFLESNETNRIEEDNLKKYFYISSDDIKDCFQDFLDEHMELSFEVIVINKNLFVINFFNLEKSGTITKETYPLSNKDIFVLDQILKDYECFVKREDDGSYRIIYSSNKCYITIFIEKS